MSLRSRSPDDNSSLLSASSLDSALNHSREEEEIRALTMEQYFGDEPVSHKDMENFFESEFNSTTAIAFLYFAYKFKHIFNI